MFAEPNSFEGGETPLDLTSSVTSVLKAAFKDGIVTEAGGSNGEVGSGWTCTMRTDDSEEGADAGELFVEPVDLPLSDVPVSSTKTLPARLASQCLR